MPPISYRHLGFTGTKDGMTQAQVTTLLKLFPKLRDDGFLWMHNGDCVGADTTAAHLWRKVKGKLILHPPLVRAYQAHLQAQIICERKGYLDRDHDIAECAELVVGAPASMVMQTRSGTWATLRYAKKLWRDLRIILPNGKIVRSIPE